MLKSTYKSSASPASTPGPASLLPGWTEHKAPSGHLYYFNAETKKSTYVRPAATTSGDREQDTAATEHAGNTHGQQATGPAWPQVGQVPQHSTWQHGQYQGAEAQREQHKHQERRQPVDRPKHKQAIPGAAPWILVRTKLRRRFVHNPETGESFWKFPASVMKCVVELDRLERERKERHARENLGDEKEDEKIFVPPKQLEGEGDEEYEEVEVTDDEGMGQDTKRQRTGEGNVRPVEFNEDDIEFQLAQMEQMAVFGDDQGEEAAFQEAPALAEEDAKALFKDLLNDYRISPFTPWDQIIDEGSLIEDDRYTVLPNMKSRKDVFDDWSRSKVQDIKKAREAQAKQDPRVPYMSFLDKFASPKLYWPEFRRKYQKEPELRDRKITDKDREKWYREHISRLKLPESRLKSDLKELLKGISNRELNCSSSLESLPSSLLRDIRYISLAPRKRDPLIEAFIATAADPPETGETLTVEEEARLDKERADRELREKALANRVDAVKEQRAKQRRELGYSKALLQEEENEVKRAKQVGRHGLLAQMTE